MQTRRPIKATAGLSLLETLVSFSLLTIMFLFLAALFLNGYSVAATADRTTAAGHLAASDMARFKDLGYENQLALVGQAPQTVVVTQNEREYSISREVRQSNMAGDPDFDVLNLSVDVAWQEKSQLSQGTQNRLVHFQLNSQVSPVATF